MNTFFYREFLGQEYGLTYCKWNYPMTQTKNAFTG